MKILFGLMSSCVFLGSLTQCSSVPSAGKSTVTIHPVHEHEHNLQCGHSTMKHGDHQDYLHDGHRHVFNNGYYEEHGEI